MQTKIIYEDDHVLVCHKPAGLATQSGRIGQPDVVSELKNYLAAFPLEKFGGKVATPYLGVVHRLDQPVEGLLVFAKSQKTAAHLTKQLAQGSLNKQYYAVVCGKPTAESAELVDYLVKEGNVAKVVSQQTSEAKKAVLQYQTVEHITSQSGKEATVLDIHIDTGRFHQIRVQMAHAGYPLLGDSKYGSTQSMELAKELGHRHVALYAYRLEFQHPVTGKRLEYKIEEMKPY